MIIRLDAQQISWGHSRMASAGLRRVWPARESDGSGAVWGAGGGARARYRAAAAARLTLKHLSLRVARLEKEPAPGEHHAALVGRFGRLRRCWVHAHRRAERSLRRDIRTDAAPFRTGRTLGPERRRDGGAGTARWPSPHGWGGSGAAGRGARPGASVAGEFNTFVLPSLLPNWSKIEHDSIEFV